MTIHVHHLTVRYGRHVVLDDIHATASAGRVTAVVGPNAAGKTTLLRAVIGAMRPTRGRVRIGADDIAVRRLRGAALASRIAYAAQRPTFAMPLTVREAVALGRYALPSAPDRIDDALAETDLATLADRPVATLSAGQRQRVTLARVLAQAGPETALVLDEPTASMDLNHAALTLRQLRARADAGATVLIAIHDLGLAARAADDAWLLGPGPNGATHLVAAGAATEVLTPTVLQPVFGDGLVQVALPDGSRVLVAAPDRIPAIGGVPQTAPAAKAPDETTADPTDTLLDTDHIDPPDTAAT